MWSFNRNGASRSWGKVLLAALALSPSLSQASDVGGREPELSGARVQIDNDLFAARNSDRDYTGGFGITISGSKAATNALSLDPLLKRIDGWVGADAGDASVWHAQQLGMLAFTPTDISTPLAQQDDRPYASLAFIANGRVQVEPNDRVAWTSTLTVGMLGLSVSRDIQNAVHRVVGSPNARGYDHQISAGGEPTARYTLARQYLWIANPSSTLDVKTTVQGSVGYLTESSVGISARVGRFASPWWSFTPEQSDYLGAATPVVSVSAPELYVFTGMRLTARAYNAFLQGQFRDSDVRYSSAELNPIIAAAWVGVATQLAGRTQVSYTLNYQSSEVRHGPASREAWWGALQLTHSF